MRVLARLSGLAALAAATHCGAGTPKPLPDLPPPEYETPRGYDIPGEPKGPPAAPSAAPTGTAAPSAAPSAPPPLPSSAPKAPPPKG